MVRGRWCVQVRCERDSPPLHPPPSLSSAEFGSIKGEAEVC